VSPSNKRKASGGARMARLNDRTIDGASRSRRRVRLRTHLGSCGAGDCPIHRRGLEASSWLICFCRRRFRWVGLDVFPALAWIERVDDRRIGSAIVFVIKNGCVGAMLRSTMAAQDNSIGQIGAAQLLLTAGDNPERLRSEASFASLCGVSPVPASSGKTVRHRLNRSGDRAANSALSPSDVCEPTTGPRPTLLDGSQRGIPNSTPFEP
jgi:hypothetical protein